MKKLKDHSDEILNYFKNNGKEKFSSKELYPLLKEKGYNVSNVRKIFTDHRIKRGSFSVSPIQVRQPEVRQPEKMDYLIDSYHDESTFIPKINENYIPWGNYFPLEKIITSRKFFPVFIHGLSGNGKTTMVEQICAKKGREFFRIQISKNTDEDDLIGGFRIIDGNFKFFKGPALLAYERGGVLCLDEVDRGSNNLLCLQCILEGKPFYVKKINQIITPAPGFTVVATANTLGRGSENGRYSGSMVLDDAFLERFFVTFEQKFPSFETEKNILSLLMKKYDCENEDFLIRLVNWAHYIRKTFFNGAVEEYISTRRLCQIIETYSIFKNEKHAIEYCINRFDEVIREAFLNFFEKLENNTSTVSQETDNTNNKS